MPYTHFRFIGYQVPTIAKASNNHPNLNQNTPIYGIPAGPPDSARFVNGQRVELIGLPDDISSDIRRKLRRLIGALMLAEEAVNNLQHKRKTLNVFIAPEFYFRPGNDNNRLAYTRDEFRIIVDVLRQTIYNGPYKNWIIIPGTIMWWRQRQNHMGHDVEVYHNTSLYICKSGSLTFEKHTASDIDGLPTGRNAKVNGVDLFPDNPNKKSTNDYREDYNLGPDYRNSPFNRRRYFRTGGIRCGAEICLEHPLGALRKYIMENDKKTVDLQLFPSGYQKINRIGISTKKNGYIMRCDGFKEDHTELKKIERYETKIGDGQYMYVNQPVDILDYGFWYSFGHQNLAITPLDDSIDINNGHDLYLLGPPNSEMHAQAIKIYPVQKIYH